MSVPTKRAMLVALVLVAVAGWVTVLAQGEGSDGAAPSTTAPPAEASSSGVTRVRLGQADPANAPGQTLYLERVTISAGTRLAEHFHEGTQVARVISGVLTYNIVSGTVGIHRAAGRTEEASGPGVVRLGPGDTVTETAGLVHFGANDGTAPVVIELAALLDRGAPLATTVGSGAAGTVVRLTADLESRDRSLFTTGSDRTAVYGWNRLGGSATVDGQTVGVDMLGAVDYTDGSGPFSGFVTFTFADGSTLGVSMQGATQASPGTANASFAAALGVVGGTGRYASTTGTGTFVGSRTAALGTTVAATFDLTLDGVR